MVRPKLDFDLGQFSDLELSSGATGTGGQTISGDFICNLTKWQWIETFDRSTISHLELIRRARISLKETTQNGINFKSY